MKPKIIVPFDFSETGERALGWAADLQRTTGGPPLLLVHAISSRPPGTSEVPLDMLLPDEEERGDLERQMIEKARRHEATATAVVRTGANIIGDIVLDAAKDAGADLIVMGSHGRTGIKRLLLGSIAEHVLRHAPCPVVIISGAKGERTER